MKVSKISFKDSKSLKYINYYWSLGFAETEQYIFEKKYTNKTEIKIFVLEQCFIFNKHKILLDNELKFTLLEFIDQVLQNGFTYNDLEIKDDGNIYFRNIKLILIPFYTDFVNIENNTFQYKSMLLGGQIFRDYKICVNNNLFDNNLFNKNEGFNIEKILCTDSYDFKFCKNTLIKYMGNDSVVCIPEGTEKIDSSVFYDNHKIRKVILPKSLKSIGGDCFYNCINLEHISIPENVEWMGNNPFAGCPKLKLKNLSHYFQYQNNILYTHDYKNLIYCNIDQCSEEIVLNENVLTIGKHAFYKCENLKLITFNSNLLRIENNPFSGCINLKIINKSKNFIFENGILYDKYKRNLLLCLTSNNIDFLELPKSLKVISRNSFWNCDGVKKIVFPESLEEIGYNPFVGCKNIKFYSLSKNFIVKNGILYNDDMSKIICYPSNLAVGDITIDEKVISLERGAFSGCNYMTSINLHNVNFINKSSFTNCNSLEYVYCSDLITFIGEWSFAHCPKLKNVSVNKNTFIDKNAFLNSPVHLIKRDFLTNYLIESDNIYTLKSMQKFYKNKIDLIAIDPPYNTNISYIGYKDSDYDEGYYNFIYKRIELAYELLSESGTLIIHIDENELWNLISMLKIFFDNKLISIHKWKKINKYFDMNRVILNPNKVQTTFEYIIVCKKNKNIKFNKIRQPFISETKWFEKSTDIPEIFDFYGTTSSAKDEIKNIFGKRDHFSTPKPIKLIKELIRACTNKNSIILDFFAGSGTTGHAVTELNLEDGGNRKFVLVSNNESNICKDVTKRRLDYIHCNYKMLG